MTDFLQCAVGVTYVASLVVNGLAATGAFGGKTNREISNENPTFITPDGLTFAVWSVIYLFEGVLVCVQFCPSMHAEELMTQPCPLTGLPVRLRIALAFAANTVWLPVYLMELFTVALLIILVYLGALLTVYMAINTRTVESFGEWLAYGVGIALNASWIVVATSANAFTVGRQYGWEDANGVGGTPQAALALVLLVAGLGVATAIFMRDVAWSGVTAWALLGIYRMQTVPDPESFPIASQNPLLASTARWSAVVVIVASFVGLFLMLILGSSGFGGRKAIFMSAVE